MDLGTTARRMAVSRYWATRRSGRVTPCRKNIGRATHNDHRSGARTARVLGTTSQPMRINASKATINAPVTGAGQPPLNANHSEMATMIELANVLPNTIVASKSCGSDSSRATTPPVCGERSTSWRACHLPREKRADSATRSEEHTSELQSQSNLVCRLLLEKKNNCGIEVTVLELRRT